MLARRRRAARERVRSQRDDRAAGPHTDVVGDEHAGHTPVLAGELVAALGLDRDPPPRVAIDCTFGDGGHARLLTERLGPTGTLVAIDRDPTAEQRFAALAA